MPASLVFYSCIHPTLNIDCVGIRIFHSYKKGAYKMNQSAVSVSLLCPYCQKNMEMIYEQNAFSEHLSLHWCDACNEIFIKYSNQTKPFLLFDYHNPFYNLHDLETIFSKKTIHLFIELCEKIKLWKYNASIDIAASAKSYMKTNLHKI